MRKILGWYVVVVCVAVVLACWPLVAMGVQSVFSGSDEPAADLAAITDYQAEFTVGDDGRMQARERITFDFPEGTQSHGIFRYFDHRDPNAPGLRRDPGYVMVAMDPDRSPEQKLAEAREYYGEEGMEWRTEDCPLTRSGCAREFLRLWWSDGSDTEQFEEDWGRYTVVRVGDPVRTVTPGEHTYEFRYKMDDVLLPQGSGSRFYWNLVPSGWDQPIEHADLRVTLPAAASDVRCAVGVGNTDGCSSSAGEGTNTLHVTADDLGPNTPVTVRSDVAASPIVAPDPLPWSQRWDPVLGQDAGRAAAVLILSLLLFLGGVLFVAARTFERRPKPAGPPRIPEGIGPAQAMYLLHERVGAQEFVRTLSYCAALGLIEVKRDRDGWSLHRPPEVSDDDFDRLDVATARVRHLLPGFRSLRIRAKDDKRGRQLAKELKVFQARVRAWARDEGYVVDVPLRGPVLITEICLVIAAVTLAFVRPWDMSVVALVPAALAAGLAPALRHTAQTRRTPAGRKLWAQLLAVEEKVTGPRPSDEKEFARALPWAVAFGSGAAWASGSDDHWWRRYWLMHGHREAPADLDVLVEEFGSAFQSSVSSSISAYERTQSSGSGSSGGSSSSGGGFSSSSGGGFSGGGGGGGGGGGVW